MAQEPKPSRPRVASTGQEGPTEPAIAPITANTPLPPLNPLPLAAEGGPGSPAGPGYPTPGLMPPDVQTPPPYQPFGSQAGKAGGFGGASAQGIPPVWAVGTIFVMLFTSLILLVVLAVNAANVDRQTTAIWWAMVILIVANVLFTLIVVNLSRGQGALSLPFLRPRRGP